MPTVFVPKQKINSRKKGHSFERSVAQDLRAAGFPNARRQLEYHEDDANGVDLQHTGDFKVQCKALNKQPNIPAVMREMRALNPQDIPMVVFKVDKQGTFAAFRYEDALKLMQLFHEHRNTQ